MKNRKPPRENPSTSDTTDPNLNNPCENSLVQNFKKYEPYGVTYNTKQDAAYYNRVKIRLFVDFKATKEAGMKYAFDLCYRDGDGTLILEAVEDEKGNLAGIG
jgi:hypothetical protein